MEGSNILSIGLNALNPFDIGDHSYFHIEQSYVILLFRIPPWEDYFFLIFIISFSLFSLPIFINFFLLAFTVNWWVDVKKLLLYRDNRLFYRLRPRFLLNILIAHWFSFIFLFSMCYFLLCICIFFFLSFSLYLSFFLIVF